MKKLILMTLVVFFTSGCVTIPKQTFNAEANRDIKNIALIKPTPLDNVEVAIQHHPASSFGLIGSVAAAADKYAKSSAYNTALANDKTDWSDYALQQLKTELGKSGYQVAIIEGRKGDETPMTFLESYPDIVTDGFFDFYFDVGHIATGPTTPYIPTVLLYSRLVRPQDKAVVYAEHFVAGNTTVAAKNATLVAGTGKSYQDLAALKASPAESAQALKTGIDSIAAKIAANLRKVP